MMKPTSQSYGVSESFHVEVELDNHSAGPHDYPKKYKYNEDQAYDDEYGGYGDNELDEVMNSEKRKVETLCADLSCLCVPTCAKNPCDICSRLVGWTVANADQFISGVLVALSLIPDSISYALIAGLPPSAALQSCWITNIITAVVGGRPGMITSASGLTALLLYRLVRTDNVVEESGIMFVPYVIMFAGLLQCIAAFIGLGRLVSAFPAVVVVGMVNAMALFTLALQLRYAKVFPLSEEELDNGWDVDGSAPAVEITWNVALFSYYGKGLEWISSTLDLAIFAGEVATAFLICVFLPKVTKCLPATLVSVLAVLGVEFGIVRTCGAGTPLIGDYGGTHVETPWETIFSSKYYSLPSLASWESWKLILGYGSALFATQFTETAIALNVVDLLDKSQGPGFLVLIGQGGANIVSGLMGGMGGSGVVNMSVLADRTFGTSCLSTFLTGALVFAFITWGYPVIDFIPLSAISGISIATVCSFIQWRSIAATFTTCLPNSTRDKLPPQFNIARLDVLIMLIVTAACLIMDVAALLFFVMAVGIFAFGNLRSYFARRKERKELDEDALGEEVVEDDDNKTYDNERPTTSAGEETDDIVEEKDVVEHETERSTEKDSNLLTACTAAIFPNCV
ncbi:hypothetical protein ACHAWU_005976 [Discostella pseudostelligera]|uniref:SLC26A/SulP transporter domain-containing protein n=1 Tax=Discostella pseudostelligera TaxID=259834 RepID=A0ABD3M8S0_9STRA